MHQGVVQGVPFPLAHGVELFIRDRLPVHGQPIDDVVGQFRVAGQGRRLQITALIRGETVDEVRRKFITGEAPLLEIGGLLGAGAGAGALAAGSGLLVEEEPGT